MTESEETQTADGTAADNEATSRGADAALGGSDTESECLESAEMGSTTEGNETVDQATQQKVLERDRYRCRACNAKAPAAGGLADLEVHHADRDPDDVGEHDLANLLTLCRSCHSWLHKRSKPSDVSMRLTETDDKELLSHDYEILRILNEHGPLRTGAIAERLTAEMSVMAVRERLWQLGGLDNKVAERAAPLVMKDVASQKWGLLDDIVTSARGHIPDDPKLLVQRTEDELMRRALDRGCDRQTVMEVFDTSRRGTFYKQKRAKMYDFPLDAFSRGGRPRVSKEASGEESTSTARGPGDAEAIRHAAARANEATSDGGGESAGEIVSDASETDSGDEQEDAAADGTETDAVQQLLEEALDAVRDDSDVEE